MATPAQCYFCFETLAASFDGGKPPKLSVVEELWAEFETAKALTSRAADAEDLEVGGSVEPPVDTDGQESQDDMDKGQPFSSTLQSPSIRRLQSAASSGSSSVSTSTPPALSTSSSRSALTSNTSISTSPSPNTSSIFSPPKPSYSETLRSTPPGASYPLFVTWNTVSRSGYKSLRGCIGTFDAQELSSGLKSYALTSAFGDTRFSPIPAQLLPSLSCSLTLLSNFETCSHALDWELGMHGIRISFVHRGRRYGATYLPDVAVDQGWTKEETVESLMRKAGWEGASSAGSVTRRFLRSGSSSGGNPDKPWEGMSEFKTVRYQGLKASASYSEWQEWRKWVESSPEHLATLEVSR
ncbi:ammecr1 family protein [Trichophyton tonsurans CBS 112818]|uniref:Ammecr1 family protein n=2 Tax=Trichophyton TaxID=5550 RepID=F2PJ02_TRIEC|nr:ammecr1 family protein [Trichophyton tonsurans CBS 112818]EGE01869.1 ammecr1 family protein [Trichophyton equinum CBS 127.97]